MANKNTENNEATESEDRDTQPIFTAKDSDSTQNEYPSHYWNKYSREFNLPIVTWYTLYKIGIK